MAPRVEVEDTNAYFVRSTNEPLLKYFNEQCSSLLDSDVRYDVEGNISYTTYHDLPKAGFLPEKYILVSKVHPQAVVYAQYSRYESLKELRIHQVKKDGGSVEAAIRSVNYVLEGEQGREANQAKAARHRAHELLDLFNKSFAEVTPEELIQAQKETYTLLGRVGLDPLTIVNEEKRRMTAWLIKGSLGKDSLGRRNWLITTMALSAAYRRAVERQKGIGVIVGKFVRMREALIFEREFCRTTFEEMAHVLETMPGHVLFKFLDRPPKKSDVGIISGMLNTMISQLQYPHVKAYRTVGRQAGTILAEIVTLLKENRRAEVTARRLIPQARKLLQEELENHKEIYPPKKT